MARAPGRWSRVATRLVSWVCRTMGSARPCAPAAGRPAWPTWPARTPVLPPEIIARIAWLADADTRRAMGYPPRPLHKVYEPGMMAALDARLRCRQMTILPSPDGRFTALIPSPSRATLYSLEYDPHGRYIVILATPWAGAASCEKVDDGLYWVRWPQQHARMATGCWDRPGVNLDVAKQLRPDPVCITCGDFATPASWRALHDGSVTAPARGGLPGQPA